jgi:hypothetical protein
MKRRFLMVSAMILLLGSQVDMFAQKRVEPDRKRPGMEMRYDRKPGKPMDGKTISQWEVEKLQDYYWKKYRVKLSRLEAEKILIAEKRDRRHDKGPQFCDKKHPRKPMPRRK